MLEVIIRHKAYAGLHRVSCQKSELEDECLMDYNPPTIRAVHPEYRPVMPLVFRVSRMIVRGGSL